MAIQTQESPVMPKVDIFESEDAFTIEAELPGVSPEGAKVEIKDGVVHLQGTPGPNGKSGKVHRKERIHRSFYRAFSLGSDVDTEHVEATMKDGVLKLTLNKVDAVRPTIININ